MLGRAMTTTDQEGRGTVRYRWLGPLEVERDEMPVAIGGPQQRRLLGVLLAHRGQVVSVDRLVDALWPDVDAPDGAARSIKTYVSRLRAALDDSAVATAPNGYLVRLDAETTSADAPEFEALVAAGDAALPDQAIAAYDAAIALWRDRPFGELADEWWAVAETRRLESLYLGAREERAAALIAVGHHARALPDLEALAVEHPFRERPLALLLQALQADGRQVEALRRYQDFRVHLAEETGLEPSADLVALERAVAIGVPTEDGGERGRPLRGYVIHEPIGEGAFGRVYAAVQPGTQRRVAVKAIRPDLADSSHFVRSFEAEAQLVARLEHPHIVPLYDYWREPGGAYLVFRLLNGGTARESLVADGLWSLARVSRLVEEIGGALIAAHAAGVAHNDVTAANIVLDDAGTCYLTDFGVAAGEGGAAADGMDRDRRGLAWVIWELLTGRRPPTAPTGPPHLLGFRDSVPEGLDAVLRRAIDGYASVAELVLGWRSAVGRPDGVASPLPTDPRRSGDPERRRAARALEQAAIAGSNPYVGLRPFAEGDAAEFFGREPVIRDLVKAVGGHPLVTVAGASGSGKSSVVLAGLVPTLRRTGWTAVTLAPGDDPLRTLHDALLEVATEALPEGDAWAAVTHVARRAGRLVLVIDQFEECWTRASPAGRDAFLDVVVRAAEADDAAVRVVATVRADLLDRPLEHPRLGAHVAAGTHLLVAMTPEQLEEAIIAPAERAGVHFDEGVVAELLAGANAQPGSLPLLQFTLAELYDRRVDATVTRGAQSSLGGMTGAVARRAEAVIAELGDETVGATRALFERLVTAGGDGPDTRRRARLGELSPAARSVAEAFVAARLLVVDRDHDSREPTVEVAHEALIDRWERLARWVDEDRAWLAQLQHLAGAARAWDDGGRSESELYRGARLEAALEAIEGEGREVTAVERAFLDAGRAARDSDREAAARSARRLRRLLAGVGVALVVALVAGLLAVRQGDRADRQATAARQAERAARVEALVGRAEALQATQRDAAALLAVEAFRLDGSPRTRSALLTMLTADDGLLDTRRFDADNGASGIVLPDGETAFLTGQDGRLRPYDLDTGELGVPLTLVGQADEPFALLVPAADSRRLAQLERQSTDTGDQTTIAIHEVASGAMVGDPFTVPGWVEDAQLSADGRAIVVSIGTEARIERYDLRTGERRASAPGLPADPDTVVVTGNALATGPDGALLAGSQDGPLRVLDPVTLTTQHTIDVPAGVSATIVVRGDGTAVAAGRDGVVRFDIGSGALRWTALDYAQACVNMTTVADVGVFCADAYGRLVERDLETGAVRRTLDAQNGNTGRLWGAKSGTELVNFGATEALVARWRLDGSGPITRVVATDWSPDHLSPDGTRLVVRRTEQVGIEQSELDFENKVIDVATGEDVADLPGLFGPLWVDDHRLIGAVVDGDQLRIAQTDLRTGRTVAEGDVLDSLPEIAAGGTGKRSVLLVFREGDRFEVQHFGLNGRRIGPTIEIEGLTWVNSSRDGDRVAVGTIEGVVVYDGRSGSLLGRIDGSDRRGAYITVAGQLFVGTNGGELTLHDLDTLEPVRAFPGSRGFIREVESTTDGSTIAVLGGDRVVNLYDVGTGVQLGSPLTIPDDEINEMAFSLDGDTLAYGGGIDRPLRIIDLDTDHWAAAACRLAGRNLTEEEWATNVGDLAPYRSTCPDLPAGTSSSG